MVKKEIRQGKCTVFNAIRNMPNTLGISIEGASNAAMLQAAPLRHLQRFWTCREQNAYTCGNIKCMSHVDYKEE